MDYDHQPVFLEFSGGSRKPANPFKFNHYWLNDESFVVLLKEGWTIQDDNSEDSTSSHFEMNLKKIKDISLG